MPANAQSQAVQTANQLINLAAQLMNIYQQMVVLDAAWTDQGSAAVLAALGTVAVGADGSTGAADANPTAGHPIDPTKYPALSHTLSATQITQLKTVLDNIVTYVNGQAVPATASARGILNASFGG